jgi:hypothetical protein
MNVICNAMDKQVSYRWRIVVLQVVIYVRCTEFTYVGKYCKAATRSCDLSNGAKTRSLEASKPQQQLSMWCSIPVTDNINQMIQSHRCTPFPGGRQIRCQTDD